MQLDLRPGIYGLLVGEGRRILNFLCCRRRLRFNQAVNHRRHRRSICAILLLTLSFAGQIAIAAVPAGGHGVAATVHPLATDAAIAALKAGGNAVDAAVAAALTLGVVDGHNSGIGGGCFFLIHTADGRVVAIDGRETAPAAATRDMFLRAGKVDPRLSQTGALASGVPGALAAYDHALGHHGKLTLREHLLRAAQLAEEGFVIPPSYAARLQDTAKDLKKFPTTAAIYLDASGQPWKAGDILKQSELAKTYRAVAENGIRWFYEGTFAQATGAWMKQHGGLLTVDDFKSYRVKLREPLRTTYRGYEILGFPPPSSGGVHVAQILNILEHFDFQALGPDSADFIHLTAEAMKLAFADRAFWLGDPDFTPVPRGLVSREYAAALARKVDRNRASIVPQHNTPDHAETDLFEPKHTTHFSTADAEGNWVAVTQTINTSFGSKVVVPGTGVVLNNQMDDFSAQPGVPNYFGLVGNEANAVAPGKRPLSSMSPTIVLKNGKAVFSAGAAGGPTIISQTVLAIIQTVDFRKSPAEALAAPRFHHQWRPDELKIEKSFPASVLKELERRGHQLNAVASFGACQAIAREGDKFSGASDPRLKGKAGVW